MYLYIAIDQYIYIAMYRYIQKRSAQKSGVPRGLLWEVFVKIRGGVVCGVQQCTIQVSQEGGRGELRTRPSRDPFIGFTGSEHRARAAGSTEKYGNQYQRRHAYAFL